MRLRGLMLACAAALAVTGCAGGLNRPVTCTAIPAPDYPPEARAAGIEGYVVLAYDLSAAGDMSNLRVVESDPPGVFDDAALAAFASLRCSAPVRRGEPMAAEAVTSRLEFALGEDYDGY